MPWLEYGKPGWKEFEAVCLFNKACSFILLSDNFFPFYHIYVLLFFSLAILFYLLLHIFNEMSKTYI